MDTNDLKVFLTYSKTQNLREAAELHKTSHIAVIRAIKRLENEIGTPLTSRSGRGSTLTISGKNMLPLIEKMLLDEQQLVSIASEKKTLLNTSVRIATFEIFSTHLSAKLNDALEGRDTEWLEKVPGAIESAIAKGQADLGITYQPIPTKGIEHLKVASIRMGLFQADSLPFARHSIAELPFVVPVQEEMVTPTKARGLDGWPDHRIPRLIKHKVTLLETAFAMTAAGQCVGYFPNFVVELYNADRTKRKLIEMRHPVEKTMQDVFLVKRKTESEDSVSKKITKVLRTLR